MTPFSQQLYVIHLIKLPVSEPRLSLLSSQNTLLDTTWTG